jgi:hypothetical protein
MKLNNVVMILSIMSVANFMYAMQHNKTTPNKKSFSAMQDDKTMAERSNSPLDHLENLLNSNSYHYGDANRLSKDMTRVQLALNLVLKHVYGNNGIIDWDDAKLVKILKDLARFKTIEVDDIAKQSIQDSAQTYRTQIRNLLKDNKDGEMLESGTDDDNKETDDSADSLISMEE